MNIRINTRMPMSYDFSQRSIYFHILNIFIYTGMTCVNCFLLFSTLNARYIFFFGQLSFFCLGDPREGLTLLNRLHFRRAYIPPSPWQLVTCGENDKKQDQKVQIMDHTVFIHTYRVFQIRWSIHILCWEKLNFMQEYYYV